ncbi:hypothetical protein D6D18_09626 [Aureobasidium pullulans]|nr:hypothetical protein D6D18_09626 [Aureobasidium pullulans]
MAIPQYAHFDAPSSNKKFNEDALPAMPSWSQGRTLRHQDDVNEMEMGSLHNNNNQASAAAPMLPKSPNAHVQEYPYQSNAGAYGGDLGYSAPSPYAAEQYGYGQAAQYSPRAQSPGYESSYAGAAPPSYHTAAPNVPNAVAPRPSRKISKDSSLEVQRRKILPITLQLKQSKSACSLARTFFRGKGAASWDASLL